MRMILVLSMIGMLAAAAAPEQREARGFGAGLRYDSSDFADAVVRQEPKLTARENGTDIPLGVGPLRTVMVLRGREEGSRSADGGRIDFIPLQDASVPHFGKAYPQVQGAASSLRRALSAPQKPDLKKLTAADLYCIDGEHALRARITFMEGPWLSGFAFLVQYTQEQLANPANNEELMYVFLGLSKDHRYYVAAHIPLRHPSLPAGVSATTQMARDPGRGYLRRNEKDLASFGGETFRPPLDHLQELIRSIEVR